MFYSKLRWKIKDLKDELEQEKGHSMAWREAYNKVMYNDANHMRERDEHLTALNEFSEKLAKAEKEINYLTENLEMAQCNLVMTEEQLTSANEEIKRLQAENLALLGEYEKLRVRRGCPCDKRRKH